MPRYEFVDGSSRKFWEIELTGTSFTTTYGRIGAAGQTSHKDFPSEERAKLEYEKLIAEKTKKGYALVSESSEETSDGAPNVDIDELVKELCQQLRDGYIGSASELNAAIDDAAEDLDLDERAVAKLRAGVEATFFDEQFVPSIRSGEVTDEAGIRDVIAAKHIPKALGERLFARAVAFLESERKLERTWTERTTNDRIDAAFAELEAAGIVALQDAGYTQSNGWDDVVSMAKPTSRGGTFYHRQDLERGLSGEGLCLSFDALPKDGDGEAIGAEIVATLRRHGVNTTWDGNVGTRIQIEPFPWRKRRFTKAPNPAEERAAADDAVAHGEEERAPSTHAASGARHFEFVEGASKKFWEIRLDGASFTTRYGKIGTNGQTTRKTWPSEEKAKLEHDKLIAEKTTKGYVEK